MAAGGFSQPVWGPELSTVGAYSREGYTSKTFDTPAVPFSTQKYALEVDEDVQLALNHLSSQISGGAHYWKAATDELANYMTDFTEKIDFDWLDTIMIKELLWYGNCNLKPRLGIANIRNKDDLMHIPISSFVRVWWDRQRRPYKYEFRGAEYQGYHNPEELIPLIWNPINASAFGQGFGVTMTVAKIYDEVTPTGAQEKRLPSLLDRKYSTQMTMHLTEKRYIPHNIYNALDSSATDRAAIKSALRTLDVGEDFVTGTKVEVQELGSNQRSFDPTKFADMVQGPIFKALNDFRGKQAGESNHSYANAKTSAMLDEVGLSSFPLGVVMQLVGKLFKPWFDANPIYTPEYGGGLVSIPWDECGYELNFGEVEKKDIPTETMIQLIDSAVNNGAVNDPIELRELYERSGLPLSKDHTEQMDMMLNDPTGVMAMNKLNIPGQSVNSFGGMGGGPNFDTAGADHQQRPYDNSNFTTGANRFPDPQPSKPYLNFTETRKISKKPIK